MGQPWTGKRNCGLRYRQLKRLWDLESWPTPTGVSPTAMIIRASGAVPDRDWPSRRRQALACEYAGPGASHGREVKAEVDASTHPYHPNGRACPARKDDSCYPVFRSNQYL